MAYTSARSASDGEVAKNIWSINLPRERFGLVLNFSMADSDCLAFLQWALPRLHLRWRGFRKVRRQVCRRVGRRIRELGLEGFGEYRAYLESHLEEWPALDAFCRITISRFYRDRSVFDFLREHVLPELAESARRRGETALRIWSAGCASGEEPYTLAIAWKLALEQRFPELQPQILATDVSEPMLARARRGCYPESSFKDLPETWRDLALRREGDGLCVKEEYRGAVAFHQQDIRREQPDGPFSLILCRHLAFTYFDEALQSRVLHNLLARLTPDGGLVAGKQETLPPAAPELIEEWAPHTGVYRRR